MHLDMSGEGSNCMPTNQKRGDCGSGVLVDTGCYRYLTNSLGANTLNFFKNQLREDGTLEQFYDL